MFILLALITQIYHDARSVQCQIELLAYFQRLIVVLCLLQMSRPVILVAVRPTDQSTTQTAVRTASSDMLQISENARGC